MHTNDPQPTAQPTPELLTRIEAAEIARVHLETLALWITAGHLPVTRLGRKVLIRRSALLEFIDHSTTAATTGPLAGRKG